MTRKPVAIPWFSVALISAAALAYELLLTRLFSIVHWHHLVGMIISLALLGYGASGTFLTLVGDRLQRHFAGLFVANALLFSLSAGAAVWLIQVLPLNPLELPWDPRQPIYLAAIYTAAAVPFLGAANCIGMTLAVFAQDSHRVYAVDLLGAGLGVAGVTALLWIWHPRELLWPVCGAGLFAALAGGWRLGLRRAILVPALVLAGAAVTVTLWLLKVDNADYKALYQATAVLGAEVMQKIPGPMGVITVVSNHEVPFRHAPGLSLNYGGPTRSQRGVFVDGEGAGVLIPPEEGRPPEFLRHLVSALPYQLLQEPRVLVLGLHGNGALLQARAHGARRVTAVEPSPGIVQLVTRHTREYAAGPHRDSDIEFVVADPRTYTQGAVGAVDLAVMGLGNSANIGGLQSQNSSFGFTTEAFGAYLRHLAPRGLIAVSGRLQLPPRETLKLTATARDALRNLGQEQPEHHLAMIRNWQMFTLVIGRNPLSTERRDAIRTFAREHGFDLVALPGMTRDEANRHHRLSSPRYFDGVGRILGPDADAFAAEYPFRIEPATDDQPFFFRFSRWDNLPELLALPAGTGFAQVDWGYWMTVAALAQGLVLALLFILVPLAVLRRSGAWRGLKARTMAYFAFVGVAFLLIEIAFIQRLQLVLGHPVYATATVLVGFLLWAGVGSYLSRRGLPSPTTRHLRTRLMWAVGIIAITALACLWILPIWLDTILTWPLAARLAVSLLVIAPLAVAMGMPFPLGLALVEERSDDLLPWAWGINGCASVVSSIAATLLAMEIGFSGLVLAAVALYLPLPWIFWRSRNRAA